jgi:hypothetical protein
VQVINFFNQGKWEDEKRGLVMNGVIGFYLCGPCFGSSGPGRWDGIAPGVNCP